ncbi:protein prenyltransferase alpha subunit repeat-containing protein 1-B [Phoenix dactylifera]|uniref:Protein prenyltransferase alpha subunit repeat-containing protein 1-B n=1 Tax=Phoenix dactylifera TaxID=42345 RepID=A0A8B7C153_PHODC|nr:protein prenyltransferase alpha subunit repeat-containing protein 1-B [Phoenix dactylifera]XP_008789409.1 protein prenyltransferase alpha subunit repeat-containing protein 1-B [Phoenix dactylifera]
MGEDSRPRGDGMELLQQFELILERDSLINEIGFVHPSQFASLNEDLGGSLPQSTNIVQSPDGIMDPDISEFGVIQYDKTAFWNYNHKLAISIQVLPQLYSAALHAYKDVTRSYKGSINLSLNLDAPEDTAALANSSHLLENEILKHTRALLILSCDFGSAWNSRKLVLSRKYKLSLFMDELELSSLILSYSPKSEYAWSHRRWVIKKVADNFQKLQEIVEEESELVKKIGERSKMNYRAWNHRCWLTFYMTRAQVLDELYKSRKWAELHVADNCCFHYRRRLMLRLLEDSLFKQDVGDSLDHKSEVAFGWVEELKWNEMLIKRYVGREALWVHRRFLSQCWVKHFATDQEALAHVSEDHYDKSTALDLFLSKELQLLHACLDVSADGFEDPQIQAQHAVSYILWMSKQIPLLEKCWLQERLREVGDLKVIFRRTSLERSLLWESLLN